MTLKHQPGMLEIQMQLLVPSKTSWGAWERLPHPCAPIPHLQERDSSSLPLSTNGPLQGPSLLNLQFSSLGY